MLVLDTDILTIIQRAEGPEYARLVTRLPAGAVSTVYVTVVTLEEQARGWLAYLASARTAERQVQAYGRLQTWFRDLCGRNMLTFDQTAATRFEELKKLRTRVGTLDLRIAAITLAHDATLNSRNLADYRRVPGLRVEDWTAA